MKIYSNSNINVILRNLKAKFAISKFLKKLLDEVTDVDKKKLCYVKLYLKCRHLMWKINKTSDYYLLLPVLNNPLYQNLRFNILINWRNLS